MEEILASIRRIIADDQEVVTAPEPEDSSAPAPPADGQALSDGEALDDDILDLAVAAPAAFRPVVQPVLLEDEVPDISFRDVEPEQIDFEPLDRVDAEPVAQPSGRAEEAVAEPEPLRAAPLPPIEQREERVSGRSHQTDHLLSHATDSTVGQAFNFLAHTVLSNNARTLEDLVREMLRPMLKDWLDDNLPTVVERLVRAEIERVARGGR